MWWLFFPHQWQQSTLFLNKQTGMMLPDRLLRSELKHDRTLGFPFVILETLFTRRRARSRRGCSAPRPPSVSPQSSVRSQTARSSEYSVKVRDDGLPGASSMYVQQVYMRWRHAADRCSNLSNWYTALRKEICKLKKTPSWCDLTVLFIIN